MKCRTHHPKSVGMVLLAALIFLGLITLVLASLTMLISNECYLSTRSQAWNACIPVAEAGIEEAVSLMRYDGTSWGWTNRLTGNGWSALSNGITQISRRYDGSSSNYYTATINVNGGMPIIDSWGYVYYTTPNGYYTNVTRKVEITSTAANVKLTMGLISSNAILMTGNTLVDSFNSSTNTGSTGGLYDAAKASDQVTVATASKLANAFEADGSSRVWGYVNVGPGGSNLMSGTSRAGSSTYVGASGAWPPGIEASRYSANFIFNYPDVSAPSMPVNGVSSSYGSLPTTTVGGTSYVVSDGKNLGTYGFYQFSSFSVSGGGTKPFLINGGVTNVVTGAFNTTSDGYMVINTNSTYTLIAGSITMDGGPPTINGAANSIRIGPNCNVTMYALSNFTITASGRLYIAPSSTLTIYAGGTVNLSGAGVINGATSPNLTLYGLPTCTNITITASANFIGSVYAPEANVTISGASPFFGSCICRTASLAGSGVFHYDQALSGVTGSTGYYLSYWHEVTP